MHLVLASKSQRRIDLLNDLGLSFSIQAADIDEAPLPNEAPDVYVLRLAVSKAKAVAAQQNGECLVLGADTIVTLAGELFGKPANVNDAKRMLAKLSGKTHEVLTGYAFVQSPQMKIIQGVARTLITFRTISTQEIETYASGGEPLDKAGAYAIQGKAAAFVSQREGSLSNVIGLPMESVTPILSDVLKIPSLLQKTSDIMRGE